MTRTRRCRGKRASDTATELLALKTERLYQRFKTSAANTKFSKGAGEGSKQTAFERVDGDSLSRGQQLEDDLPIGPDQGSRVFA